MQQFVALYAQFKTSTAQWIGITNAECHIHAGLLIYLASSVILRKPLRSPVPLLIVIAAEAANEYFDRLSTGSWRWDDTVHDILFTLLWPAILFTLARLRKLKSG
ncbi:hypothetical protein [Sphingomonas sp. C3-2]|uniref:hypothetical protein n=1 Tax=Sphingomonas sp. C3-2 TaxID=3062169 RepID=UPI00294AF0CB|nr:hypothetical protein [Sphingomonas sp. C3-2]WOK37135.1 hypothetical protein QYC26_02780 [Sphingomonas sp. C3-2]